MAKKNPQQRQYTMTVSGGLVKHLGLQMYSGAVPAIAELISNAWDAMARNVWITIPFDKAIKTSDEITVKDDGHGMTFDECNDAYLVIGRDRRNLEGDYTRKFDGMPKRKLQSRKGIGKLAGFGIANDIEVRTLPEDGIVSHFTMNYNDIVKDGKFVSPGGYQPTTLGDDAKHSTAHTGTTIKLRNLKITRSISRDQFIKSMARRFTILSHEFKVFVNNVEVTRTEIPFQFRFPKKAGEWQTVKLSNGESIKWWAGFTERPIASEDARGFVVYARGKLAQSPWFFDLSGGAWGQHGMQYMTGEVVADFLDETKGHDLIATDRGTVRWEDPTASPLKDWGLKKVKELLGQWATKRSQEKIKSQRVQQFLQLADKLPDRERKIFRSFVEKVTSIPQVDVDQQGREILDELVEFGYNAVTNRAFIDIIKQLNAADPASLQKLSDALAEWDIIEAISTARVVRGRVEIIRNFSKMITDGVPEKPDMQEYLKQHPWLIDPKWTTLVHEQTLDKLIEQKFKVKPTKSSDGKTRLDFFCLGDKHKVAYVVELKRPQLTVGRDEMDQLRNYVLFLREQLQDSSTDEQHRHSEVKGLLICSKIKQEDEQHRKNHQASGVMDIRLWNNLLHMSEQLHGEFLEVVKSRAPQNDPRIEELSNASIGAPVKKAKVTKKSKRRKNK